jgi:hypothetical protein
LAKYFLSLGEFEQARQQLAFLADTTEKLELSYQLAIALGDQIFIDSHFERLLKAASNKPKLELLVKNINRYQIAKPVNKPISANIQQGLACPYPVQFLASDFGSLARAESLINQLTNKASFSDYFCFATPRYIAKSLLQCNEQENTPLMCNEQVFASLVFSEPIRYLAVILEVGQANVNHGIMYLDKADDSQVFEHELLHFLGFADEYPLPAGHNLCLFKGAENHPQFVANNLVLAKPGININQVELNKLVPKEIVKRWVKSNTCDANINQAWQPDSKASQLASYQYPMPASYWQLLSGFNQEFLMPSYHYNIAQALAKAELDVQAFHWLDLAITKEKQPKRIKKIRLGGF